MALNSENIIEISSLSFARQDKPIFKDISMTIKRGKITAIMGPSGTGKTTLLRLIAGLLVPDHGQVKVNGEVVAMMNRKQLAAMRRQMGMLFQNGALFTSLTVFDNVAYPLREHTNLPEVMIRDLVLMKLHAVGLRGARDLFPRELSGGMNRRVALARAIALDPKLIMYDEPFAGQDPISMGILLKLIRLLNSALGLTSIVVSHDIHETISIADYIYVIADGKVIGQGSAEELQQQNNPEVSQFMNGLPDGPIPFHYPAPDYADDLLRGDKR